jgi:hypothetical protein
MGERKGRFRFPFSRQRFPSAVLHSRPGAKPVPLPSWSLPESLELRSDTSPAGWIEERLPKHRWATVGSVVPDGFEAYARLLHPAHKKTSTYEREQVSWTWVATQTGRVVHPLVQFARLAELEDHLNGQPEWGDRPHEGDLPSEFVGPLTRLLTAHTSTPDLCWYCIWEGWGALFALRGYEEGHPKVEVPGRSYLLIKGSLESLADFDSLHVVDGPSIWWPDDRAWCVSTDIDLDSTYVGGSAECIDALTQDPALEVLPARLEDPVDFASDTINR